jgi:putative transposase
MPRRRRGPTGDFAYHVLNRAVRRVPLFENDAEYAEFEDLLLQTMQREPMRLVSYCAMRTHWHLIVWPRETSDTSLPRFMHRLTMLHAQRWHAHRNTSGTGPVYQGRYKAVSVTTDDHFLTACRYVERNPLRAGLVSRAEEWRWSSLWRRHHHCSQGFLSDWPVPIPSDWLDTLKRR